MSVCLRTIAAGSAPPARSLHAKYAPSEALAPFVAHYWITRWDRRDQPAKVGASLLDPCVHLLVREGQADVMGLLRGTYRTEITGIGHVIGVQFKPGGFHPFAQRDVTEFTDRSVPARDVFGDVDAWAMALSNAIDDAPSVIVSRLDAMLEACNPRRDANAEDIASLVAHIASDASVRRVADLVRASGRSERTLHRMFARYVGASPAWVIRRHRLQAAARRLTQAPPADVRVVAWDAGYADQAHFIRDFRATIGVTPSAYAQSRSFA